MQSSRHLHSFRVVSLQAGSPTVTVIVQATEVGGTGLWASQTVTIQVTPVPKPPVISPGQVLQVGTSIIYV